VAPVAPRTSVIEVVSGGTRTQVTVGRLPANDAAEVSK
jgi:hypothetical protein